MTFETTKAAKTPLARMTLERLDLAMHTGDMCQQTRPLEESSITTLETTRVLGYSEVYSLHMIGHRSWPEVFFTQRTFDP